MNASRGPVRTHPTCSSSELTASGALAATAAAITAPTECPAR
jgi:hypothetical protein